MAGGRTTRRASFVGEAPKALGCSRVRGLRQNGDEALQCLRACSIMSPPRERRGLGPPPRLARAAAGSSGAGAAPAGPAGSAGAAPWGGAAGAAGGGGAGIGAAGGGARAVAPRVAGVLAAAVAGAVAAPVAFACAPVAGGVRFRLCRSAI